MKFIFFSKWWSYRKYQAYVFIELTFNQIQGWILSAPNFSQNSNSILKRKQKAKDKWFTGNYLKITLPIKIRRRKNSHKIEIKIPIQHLTQQVFGYWAYLTWLLVIFF